MRTHPLELRTLPNRLREQSRAQAPWLYPTSPTISKPAALGLVLAMWAFFWGGSVIAAVEYLTGHFTYPTLDRWYYLGHDWERLGMGGLLVMAALLATRQVAPQALRPPRNGDLSLLTGLASLMAICAGFTAFAVVDVLIHGDHSYPMPSNPSLDFTIFQGIGLVLAGPTEEVFFCLAGVTLLRQAQIRWRWVAAILLLLRLSFHVYYSWPAGPLVLVWAGLVLAVYVWQGRWLAIAVTHSLFDLQKNLMVRLPAVGYCLLIVELLLFVAWVVFEAVRPHAPKDHAAM